MRKKILKIDFFFLKIEVQVVFGGQIFLDRTQASHPTLALPKE